MAEDKSPLWRKHIVAGELFATKVPHEIRTILGSCVAVCLWDPDLLAGGMNHFMLPEYTGSGEASNKYGDISIRSLIQRMESLGSKKSSLKAKVYGGGSLLSASGISQSSVGQQNIHIAMEMLRSEGISIVSRHVGDFHGRKLRFNTCSGSLSISMVESISAKAAPSSNGRPSAPKPVRIRQPEIILAEA
ncbi:hypothetical protein LCGC14_2224780 [marine sediment metagenome]|uniref:Chemoreceptor glutamine deamidase CheD n=1 Tax=marine sediment metagenome TaxID=412755 RepID=A0A0F9G5F4_9ZZZZ